MIRNLLNHFPRLKRFLKYVINVFASTSKINPIKRSGTNWIDTHNINNTILFVGSPRSGTTWISNLLNHDNYFRYIFEPFREEIVEMAAIGQQPYVILPENTNQSIINAMTVILSGRLKQIPWINKYNRRKIASRRLIKGIRAHFFLKWLKDNFPEVKIVYLMRHPVPASLSKVNWESGWNTSENYLLSAPLYQRYLLPHQEIIRSAQTRFEIHIVTWCIQNYVALKEMKNDDLLIVYYEDFCMYPEKAMKEMTNYAGVPFHRNKFIKIVGKPFISKDKSAIVNNEDLVLSWQNKVTPAELAFAMQAVKAFGLDEYYNESPYPLKSRFRTDDGR